MNSEKSKRTSKINKDKKEMEKQEIAKTIQEETKKMLLPAIKEKMETVVDLINKQLEKSTDKKTGKVKGLTSTQILGLITSRSTADIAVVSHKTYTEYELSEAFNIYIDMITKINEICKFPPSKGSFCSLLGISKPTYDSYLVDPKKREIMGQIENYLTTNMLISSQLGEVREISTIFGLKAEHGFVEANAPVVIKHESSVDIDNINSQLEALKHNKVIDAEFEEN